MDLRHNLCMKFAKISCKELLVLVLKSAQISGGRLIKRQLLDNILEFAKMLLEI